MLLERSIDRSQKFEAEMARKEEQHEARMTQLLGKIQELEEKLQPTGNSSKTKSTTKKIEVPKQCRVSNLYYNNNFLEFNISIELLHFGAKIQNSLLPQFIILLLVHSRVTKVLMLYWKD